MSLIEEMESFKKEFHEYKEVVVKSMEKLDEYNKLKEQKRLVILPAAIGEMIFFLNGRFVLEGEITSYSVNEDGAWLMWFDVQEKDKTYSYNAETEKIGRTIFFSRDDAYDALAKNDDADS